MNVASRLCPLRDIRSIAQSWTAFWNACLILRSRVQCCRSFTADRKRCLPRAGDRLTVCGPPLYFLFMPGQDVTHFTTVDHTSDPAFFLHFLDEANRLPGAIAWKPAVLSGLHLEPGMKVLDVGCGMGADAFDVAALVESSGVVTGVDFSESLISEAIHRAADRNLSVNFEVG